MHKIKVLGVALVAVLAMSALAASAASAQEFQSSSYPVTLKGTQTTTNVLKTTAGSAECKKAEFASTTSGASKTVTVTPTYGECTCLGVACTVDMNGCDYKLLEPTALSGKANLECPGTEVTLTSSKCTIHVPATNNVGTITYTHEGSGTTTDVKLHLNVINLPYSHTEGAGVGKCTTGNGTNGTLTGDVTVTGVSHAGEHTGIFIS